MSPPSGNYRVGSWIAFCVVAIYAFQTFHNNFESSVVHVGASSSSSSQEASTTIIYKTPNDLPDALIKNLDVIMVLGGGVPETVEKPPFYAARRCDDAVEILQRYSALNNNNGENLRASNNNNVQDESSSLPILCLSAGTAHLPQALSADGLPIWEATSCAGYLRQKHGLSKKVYVETTSFDTISNAFFARTTHSDVTGWRNILVITNEFHIERTKAIFDWIFVQVENNKRFISWKGKYRMHYLSTPNVGLTEEAIAVRMEKERQSEKNVREVLAPKYTTLKAVWEFLNESHSFYTSSKLVDRAKGKGDTQSSDAIKKSYGAASYAQQ